MCSEAGRRSNSRRAILRLLSVQITVCAAMVSTADAAGSQCSGLFQTNEAKTIAVTNQRLSNVVKDSPRGGGLKSAYLAAVLVSSRRDVLRDQSDFVRTKPNQTAQIRDVAVEIQPADDIGVSQNLIVRRPGTSEPEILKNYRNGQARLVQTKNGVFVLFGESNSQHQKSVERITIGRNGKIIATRNDDVVSTGDRFSNVHVVGDFVLQLAGSTLQIYHPTANNTAANLQARYFHEFSHALSTDLRILRINENGTIEIEIAAMFVAVAGPVYSPFAEATRVTSRYTLIPTDSN